MNKKIIVVGFLASILLMMPFTSVANTPTDCYKETQTIDFSEKSNCPLDGPFCKLLFYFVLVTCAYNKPLCYILGPIYMELCQ